MSHIFEDPVHASKLSSTSLLVVAVATAIAIGSFGCDDGIPEKIAVVPDNDTVGSCDGECEPSVRGMCGFVNLRPSMKLGTVVDVDDTYEEVPCEERKYRRSHSTVTLHVVDPIAGEDMGKQLELINFGRPMEEDKYYIVYPWEHSGLFFVGFSREIVIDDDAADLQSSSSDTAGLEVIYDVPTNYAAFAAEAEEHWYNFDEKCPDWDIHEYGQMTDEEFEDYLYDKDCPSGDPAPANQNDGEEPWSQSEDEDL